MSTLELIKAIRYKKADKTDNLIQLAARNKVLLHLLRVLNINNDIREERERKYSCFINSLNKINDILLKSNYKYAFFKLYKPIEYVPADIDILVSAKDSTKVAKLFMRYGYKIEVLEPYTITLTRGKTLIDLYIYPSLGNIIYLDGQKLLEYRTKTYFNYIEIVSLKTYAEAVATLTHAIDKEWIYTLNDYFTVSKWLDRKSVRLCRELGCLDEIKIAYELNHAVERGAVELPYKIPKSLILKIYSSKLVENSYTRLILLRSLSRLKDERLGKSILSKLTRITY